MKSPLEMAVFIAVLAAATMLTRFLPFWLPPRFSQLRFVQVAKRSLPAVILLLLVVYSVKDARFFSAPWGIPELVSLAVVVGLHLWRRNALLSIATGTGVYMLFANAVLTIPVNFP